LGDKSPIKNFLAKNPDGGIHHICLEVCDCSCRGPSIFALCGAVALSTWHSEVSSLVRLVSRHAIRPLTQQELAEIPCCGVLFCFVIAFQCVHAAAFDKALDILCSATTSTRPWMT
jgi:hypothetical protein